MGALIMETLAGMGVLMLHASCHLQQLARRIIQLRHKMCALCFVDADATQNHKVKHVVIWV